MVPLYGPWKFQIGDSPLDIGTQRPLWAKPDFDDTKWESVDLGPKDADPVPHVGSAGRAAGWTAKGHRAYWGYAWYRIKFQLVSLPANGLALAGPAEIDDAYQVFADGRVVGNFGNFGGRTPNSYYSQPEFFRLPELQAGRGKSNLPVVIAFRVWMDPSSLTASEGEGGIRIAPIIGEADAVYRAVQIQRMELIRSYSPWAVEALLYAIMALGAFSLILFDRFDRVYLWIGSVFLCTAAYSGLSALDVWTTQGLSILADEVLTNVILGPLAYAGWLIVWWTWFGRRWSARLPRVVAILTLSYMLSFALGMGLFYPTVPHHAAFGFQIASLFVRFFFVVLLMWIVVDGIVRQGIEGWLVLPAVLLLCIGLFDHELSSHVQLVWFLSGARLSIGQIANLLLAGVLALLVLRRLLVAVRRQREISFSLKQAQLQSDFVAAVSHEFRSPLTTLRTITELLAHNRIIDESRRQESYRYLERETARLHRLVEDLLDFGRMESGRKQYRVASHDAFQLVRATLAEFAEQAEANGFRVESQFESQNGHPAAIVQVDEEAVRRAVRNLLDNAMKYSPEFRTIWVKGSVENDKVCISVRDQGMGIGADEHQAIFQKFVRGAAAKEAGIKGTGIGLAMVRQIIEAMHGEVQLKSEIGIGSTFTLLLPLAKN